MINYVLDSLIHAIDTGENNALCARPQESNRQQDGVPTSMNLPSSRQLGMIIYLYFRLTDGFPKSSLTHS